MCIEKENLGHLMGGMGLGGMGFAYLDLGQSGSLIFTSGRKDTGFTGLNGLLITATLRKYF